MRLPSSPRTEMREALPKPPVFLMVTPTVRANTSLRLLAVPCNWRAPITDTGIADSLSILIMLRPVTCTSSKLMDSFFVCVLSRAFSSTASSL